MTNQFDSDGVNDMDHMSDDMDTDDVQDDVQNPDIKPQANAFGEVKRCEITGKFLPGTARGPGRPHGSKGKLNKTVVDTLSAIWEKRGMEVLEELADTNPAALAAIVSRLVPQDMVREAIDGDEAKDKGNTDITIRLVQQVQENQALEDMTTRLVEGELLPKDTTH
jgi:hypothetical protein